MTEEQYREHMVSEIEKLNSTMNDIKDYQKVIIVYLEAMAESPEFDAIKSACAQSIKDTSTMLKIVQRRWSA